MLFSPYKLQKINNLNLQFIMSKDDLNFVRSKQIFCLGRKIYPLVKVKWSVPY
jgi:hypothetical protein